MMTTTLDAAAAVAQAPAMEVSSLEQTRVATSITTTLDAAAAAAEALATAIFCWEPGQEQ